MSGSVQIKQTIYYHHYHYLAETTAQSATDYKRQQTLLDWAIFMHPSHKYYMYFPNTKVIRVILKHRIMLPNSPTWFCLSRQQTALYMSHRYSKIEFRNICAISNVFSFFLFATKQLKIYCRYHNSIQHNPTWQIPISLFPHRSEGGVTISKSPSIRISCLFHIDDMELIAIF